MRRYYNDRNMVSFFRKCIVGYLVIRKTIILLFSLVVEKDLQLLALNLGLLMEAYIRYLEQFLLVYKKL